MCFEVQTSKMCWYGCFFCKRLSLVKSEGVVHSGHHRLLICWDIIRWFAAKRHQRLRGGVSGVADSLLRQILVDDQSPIQHGPLELVSKLYPLCGTTDADDHSSPQRKEAQRPIRRNDSIGRAKLFMCNARTYPEDWMGVWIC